MLHVGEQLNWQPGWRVMLADDQAVGQMYVEQYFLHKDPKMIDAMRARLDTEIATPDPTDPKRPLWWWCDALFMAPPVYADMFAATGDKKYLDFMDHEWDITTTCSTTAPSISTSATLRISTSTRKTASRSSGRAATAG